MITLEIALLNGNKTFARQSANRKKEISECTRRMFKCDTLALTLILEKFNYSSLQSPLPAEPHFSLNLDSKMS